MADVAMCLEDGAVNQYECSSGKNDVNCVNWALLNVKLQNVLQELKSVRLIIALLQEDMNILKEEHKHKDTSGNTVPTSIHNYKEGTFSSVNGKSWTQVTVDPQKKISPNIKKIFATNYKDCKSFLGSPIP
jgi:hypothetical protein